MIDITTIADLASRLEHAAALLDSCALVQTERATYRTLLEVRQEIASLERDVLELGREQAKYEHWLSTVPADDTNHVAEWIGAATVGGMLQ